MISAWHLIWIIPLSMSFAFGIGLIAGGMANIGKRDDERRAAIMQREPDWKDKVVELYEEK